MAKIDIDFQILPTFSLKKILVVDTSDWAHIKDKPSIIEILLPGETKPIVHYFDKLQVNVFNSNNLGLDCDNNLNSHYDLPDGIYHFTVKGSPDTFFKTKQFLKTDRTQREFDEYIESINYNITEISEKLLNNIQLAQFFLDASESNARLGNYVEAQELLFKAQAKINKLKGCKTCV